MGSAPPTSSDKVTIQGSDKVTIQGSEIHAISPEGVEASMPLGALLERVADRGIDTGELILPDGVKAIVPGSNGIVVVHQTPPRVYAFKWIAKDSPGLFGENAVYRDVRLALPYLVVLASFERDPRGGLDIHSGSECFFRTAPIKSLGDELCFPALLNCSKFPETRGKPLAWICVQHLRRRRRVATEEPSRRFEQSLRGLLSHLLETGFNYSSEHHEGSSWFTATVEAGVDPRVASVETWEAATTEDPLFVLDVPWLPTGRSLGEMVRRVGSRQKGRRTSVESAGDLARVLFNGQKKKVKK